MKSERKHDSKLEAGVGSRELSIHISVMSMTEREHTGHGVRL